MISKCYKPCKILGKYCLIIYVALCLLPSVCERVEITNIFSQTKKKTLLRIKHQVLYYSQLFNCVIVSFKDQKQNLVARWRDALELLLFCFWFLLLFLFLFFSGITLSSYTVVM